MRLILNAGFGSPIGIPLLAEIKALGFSGVRQDILRPEDAAPLIEEQRLAGMDSIYIVRNVPTAIAAAEELPGITIECGNEEDSKQTPKQYQRSLWDAYHATFNLMPVIFTAGITTTDKKRLGWLREVYALGVPAEVHCAIHTYRQETRPSVPRPGFSSREAEYQAVREIIGPKRRLILSEIGWHTAPYKTGGFLGWGRKTKRLSDDVIASNAAEEIAIARANGVESFTWYQIGDGPDPNEPNHCFGIRRMDGTWRPIAGIFKGLAYA